MNLLETPTGGSILYHGEDITDPKINVPAYRSKVGMVFQSFNLFNNMTVLENCMVGQIKVAGRKKEEAEEKAMAYLKRLTWTRTSMQNRVNFPVVRNSVLQLQGLRQWSRKSCFFDTDFRIRPTDGRRSLKYHASACAGRPYDDRGHT